MMFKKSFFGHTSLGDNFVLNGIIHHYATISETVYVAPSESGYNTIKTLYSEHDNIVVLKPDEPRPEPNEESPFLYSFPPNCPTDNPVFFINPLVEYSFLVDNVSDITYAGHSEIMATMPLWDRQMYDICGLPFSMRYTNFKKPKDNPGSDKLFNGLVSNEPYGIVAMHMRDDYTVPPLEIKQFRDSMGLDPKLRLIGLGPTSSNNMMDYVRLIENAQEIHVTPSSMHCLVDSLETKGTCFFHNCRANNLMAPNSRWNNNKWTMVQYLRKF